MIFILCLGCLLSGCHRSALRLSPTQPYETPNRHGQQTLAPPLELAWTVRPNVTPGKRFTALDDYILFAALDGQITALDIRTGKTRWTLKERQKGEKSCAIRDSILIVVKGFEPKSLSAVNLRRGKTLWQVDAGPVESEPLICGNRVIVGNDRGEIQCFDFDTGKQLWMKRLQGRVRGDLAADDSTLFAMTDKAVLSAQRFGDGQITWQTRVEGSAAPGPIILDDRIFIGVQEGRFCAVNKMDGRILWEHQCEGGIFTEAASDAEAAYVGTSRGMLYALNPQDGTTIWRFEANAPVGTPPVLTADTIYLGLLDGRLIAIDPQTGTELWSYTVKGRIRTAPLIWNNHLIIGSDDQRIYGFTTKK